MCSVHACDVLTPRQLTFLAKRLPEPPRARTGRSAYTNRDLLLGILRVLRPGGRLVLEEIMTGSRIPVRFPVPWASDQALSFLHPPAAIRHLLAELGFVDLAWADITSATVAAIAAPAPSIAAGTPSPLSVRILLGANAEQALGNLVCNLAEGRIAVVRAVLLRGGHDQHCCPVPR